MKQKLDKFQDYSLKIYLLHHVTTKSMILFIILFVKISNQFINEHCVNEPGPIQCSGGKNTIIYDEIVLKFNKSDE